MASEFSAPAAKIWNAIPSATRKALLSRVWCGHCRREVVLTDFSGSIKSGNLALVGSCSECHQDASRVVELKRSVEAGEEHLAVVLGPPRLTDAQALAENKLVMKDSKAISKRIRELTKKAKWETLTKAEDRELNKLFRLNTDILLESAERLRNAVRSAK